MDSLTDGWGREIKSVRVSVTDKCNFRCRYCMPAEGLEWLGRDELLTFEELSRVVSVLAEMGVEEVRLTGGEPLARRDLPDLVSMLSRIPGVTDLSLTTNGVLLDRFAGPLVDAGLRRLNVSLDSLSHVRFAEITRRSPGWRLPRHIRSYGRSRSTASQSAASPRRRSRRSPSLPAASRTSSGSSSSCPSTPRSAGPATTSSPEPRSER